MAILLAPLCAVLLTVAGPGLSLTEPECLVSVSPSPMTTLTLPGTSPAALQARWLKTLHREMATGRIPKPAAKKPDWTRMLKQQLQGHGSLKLDPVPGVKASPR
jgi:hypothetical protein